MNLEYLHGSAKKKVSFNVESFEEILNFIKQSGNASACDCSTKCRNGTILNMYVEDEAQHLFISKDEDEMTVEKKSCFCNVSKYRLFIRNVEDNKERINLVNKWNFFLYSYKLCKSLCPLRRSLHNRL